MPQDEKGETQGNIKLEAKTNVGSNEQNQAYVALTKRKGKFGKFGPRRKGKTWLRFSAMDVKNMGTIEEIVLNLKRTIIREIRKKPILPKKWKNLRRRSLRRRKLEISTMTKIISFTKSTLQLCKL